MLVPEVALREYQGGVLVVREDGVEVGLLEAEQEGKRVVCEGGRGWWGWERRGAYGRGPFGEGIDELVAGDSDVGFHPV